MKKIGLLILIAVLAAVAVGSASAAPAKSSAKKPSLLARLHGHKAATKPTMASKMTGSGPIIGNKNTHVYHLPSDKSMLPDPKNRVYFKTEAAATAAGYHHAASKSAGAPKKSAKMAGKKPAKMAGKKMAPKMGAKKMAAKKMAKPAKAKMKGHKKS